MTLWERYNGTRTLRSVFEARTGVTIAAAIPDKTLYALLKRHLTRRELHGFVLVESGVTPEEIAKALSMDGAQVSEVLAKAEGKLCGAKLTDALRTLNAQCGRC